MKLLKAAGVLLAVFAIASSGAASQRTTLSPAESEIEARILKLRSVPDIDRGGVTKAIALDTRKLPASDGKVLIATGLADLSTEGDFGHETLQAVATTLADALKERPQANENGHPAFSYTELAQLARYEHVKVLLPDPAYKAAEAELTAIHADQARADFTLTDITGKSWTRSALKGKVVLVNFWATWCPPCRKEMPDLERLYKEFGGRGLVVLGISGESAGTVDPFIAKQGYTFPILLDPGGKVHTELHIQGIPNSFVYDRQGRLVAQAIDMRTRAQFLKLLAAAGLGNGSP